MNLKLQFLIKSSYYIVPSPSTALPPYREPSVDNKKCLPRVGARIHDTLSIDDSF